MINDNTRHDVYVDVKQLSYAYSGAGVLALDGIDLQISKGQIFGLLGPNGAGKSTLLSILSGILPLQSGSIVIGGKSLAEHRQWIKTRSALVPQDYAFYTALTAGENLEFFAALLLSNKWLNDKHSHTRQSIRSRINYAIEVCQLQKVLDQPAKQFSGGLKRRLNLAIGLLGEPELLYLDEPTVGIDTQSRHFILEMIKGLKKTGTTVVYTSHYLEEVEALCDAVVIVDQGKVIYRSPANESGSSFSKGELEKQFLQLTHTQLRD